jgi:hypothetical protein
MGAKDHPGAENMPQARKFGPKFEEVHEKPPPKAGRPENLLYYLLQKTVMSS